MAKFQPTVFDDPSKDSPALVIIDAGNDNLRAIKIAFEGGRISQQEVMIPHAVQAISCPEDYQNAKDRPKTDWEIAQSEAQGKSSRQLANNTHYLKYKTSQGAKAFKVGNEVRYSMNATTLLGTDKYIGGYFDMLVGMLLNVAFPEDQYPKGHNNLLISYGFPSKMYNSYKDRVEPLVDKIHYVESLSGVRRKFIPSAVQGNEETFGGLAQLQSRLVNGQIRLMNGQLGDALKDNDSMIIADFGGFEGTMAFAYYDASKGVFFPDYESTQPISGGIGRVRADLRPVLFAKLNKLGLPVSYSLLTDRWINDVIKNRYAYSGSKKIDLAREVEQGMAYVAEVKRVYTQAFSSGNLARFVGITGGTIAVLENELLGAVKHDNVVLASNKEHIVMANIYGMRQVFIDSLSKNKMLPMAFQHFMEVQ